MIDRRAIAILDSGVGGLTVAKEVLRQLPQERVLYFGDTARAPYGPRSEKEIVCFTEQIVRFLMNYDPKMIVIACNTATAVAIERIRELVPVPVLGVIAPGARAAIERTKCGRIGVIGTERTIRSGAYETALHRIDPEVRVISLACPTFVPIVEQGRFASEAAKEAVCEALRPLQREEIDTLILGCTHYPFLADRIQECMGDGVALISSADQAARDVSTLLHYYGKLAAAWEEPEHRFFCSGDADRFQWIAQSWLGRPIRVTSVLWKEPKLI